MTHAEDTRNSTIIEVAHRLRDAQRVLFITGAGISAESGLPTYRGIGGLYNSRDTEDDVPIEVALSGPMFKNRPALTWKYLWQIGSSCIGATPNLAHKIIAEVESVKSDVWVLTQNVDGLHRLAGSRNLIEVHGHMYDLYCTVCGQDYTAKDLLSNFGGVPSLPPECPSCHGVIRPKVVLFGEMLSESVTQAMIELINKDFDLVFSIGTSALFPYIQDLLFQAQSNETPVIEINPAITEVSQSCQHHIDLGAAQAMQQIWTSTHQ